MFAGSADFNLTENALFYLAGSVTYNKKNADYIMTGTGLWNKFNTAPGTDPWGLSLGTILAF